MAATSLSPKSRFAAIAVVSISVLVLPIFASAQEFGPVPPIEVDAAKAELGKRLFFDKRLSGDAAISCATCHVPEMGFADGLALSKAYPGSEGFRNTPTLINSAHKAAWFHDGRLGTNLNDVTREVLTVSYIMNMDMRLMQERLKQDPVYVEMFAASMSRCLPRQASESRAMAPCATPFPNICQP